MKSFETFFMAVIRGVSCLIYLHGIEMKRKISKQFFFDTEKKVN